MADDDDFDLRFPYECRTLHDYSIVVPWCEQQFGEYNGRWMRYGADIASGIAGESYDHYRLAREQDAVLFRLRWS